MSTVSITSPEGRTVDLSSPTARQVLAAFEDAVGCPPDAGSRDALRDMAAAVAGSRQAESLVIAPGLTVSITPSPSP